MITSGDLIEPSLVVRTDLSMGSDHHPVSLSFTLPTAPPPPSDHPRLLWNLSKLAHPRCEYVSLFASRVQPLYQRLKLLIPGSRDLAVGADAGVSFSFVSGFTGCQSDVSGSGSGAGIDASGNDVCPDIDGLADELTAIIHSSLDDSVGRRVPRPPVNA
ncbi:hypothetical protein ABG067_008055, partial [Albugo candida]